ncbi:hypothetical protein AVEN_99728-1 [Araneus ventricosus]|uniref:Uncharacterized protein n=1 Tax=Araneus ventricosus TaxID=182803 RepID=A0A4Y2RR40_ARAVE|nr:hypothetical protein AVEN_99728-1 [Araneus ventricosus]
MTDFTSGAEVYKLFLHLTKPRPNAAEGFPQHGSCASLQIPLLPFSQRGNLPTTRGEGLWDEGLGLWR